ncbi:MAG: ribbon-helix-helix protein, CopG family [Planctomycetota bacterium]
MNRKKRRAKKAGGGRKGVSKPRVQSDRRGVLVRLDESLVESLDNAAEVNRTSRNEVIQRILTAAAQLEDEWHEYEEQFGWKVRRGLAIEHLATRFEFAVLDYLKVSGNLGPEEQMPADVFVDNCFAAAKAFLEDESLYSPPRKDKE